MPAAINPPRGEQHPGHKLTEAQVREIRRNVRGLTAKQLAAQYGVHFNLINRIRWFELWRHVR